MPDEARLVVRGEELDEPLLRAGATNFRERFADWRRYGVSAFLATGDMEVDTLCATRLVRFESVVVFARERLVASGIEVVPTFRTPHVTLAHEDLDELVGRLQTCEREVLVNPYHDDEE